MTGRAWGSRLVGAVLAAAVGAGCVKREVRTFELPGAVVPKPGSIQVHVDPRVELFCVLFGLAGANEYRRAAETPYAADVARQFGPFKSHPAVAATAALIAQHDLGFNAPLSLAAYLDAALEPRAPLSPAPEGLDERWRGVAVAEYAAKVRAFAEEAGFGAFFSAHAAYYADVEQRYRALVERDDVAPFFDSLFGPNAHASHIVVPGLLTGSASYGAVVVLPSGERELYQVVGLERVDAAGLPRPGDTTLQLLVHEMAHGYVSSALAPYLPKLEPTAAWLYPFVSKQLEKQAYGDWRTMTYESFVRATVVLFLRERRGADAANKEVLDQKDNAFYWVGDLANLLAKDRTAPREPLDFARAVKDAGALFEATALHLKTDGLPVLPFHGPINSAAAAPDVLLVAPAESASPELARYVREVRGRFFKDARIVTPAGASERRRSLIAYGSPSSNSFVAGALSLSGLVVRDGEISVGDKRFTGPGLVLIVCIPRPEESTASALLYTAAKDADLVGVNSVFHGPSDWIVAQRDAAGKYEVLGTGVFPKDADAQWTLPSSK